MSESSSLPPAASTMESTIASAGEFKFLSVTQVDKAHADLLQRTSSDRENSVVWDDVLSFVDSACAAGSVLVAESERETVQNLVNYWSNALYRVQRVPKETLLADFDPGAGEPLTDDQCPYRTSENGAGAPSRTPPGWQRLIRESIKSLDKNHLVAVFGQSGGGRGFLIFDGILPKLQSGVIESSQEWRVLPQFTPFTDPLSELLQLLAPQLIDGSIKPAEQFRRDSSFLKQVLDQSGRGTALLIVNRFEQFFTIKSDEATAFFDNLRTLVEQSQHRVILKIRSDAMSRVAADPTLEQLLQRSQVLVMLTAQEIRQSIEEPAKRIGLQFESGLVDRLVQDVQGEHSAPQLLRFTLLQLWDHRTRNLITWEVYRKFGGGRTAVERAADHMLDVQLKDRPQEFLKWIWTRLIRIPDYGRDVDLKMVLRSSLHTDILYEPELSHLSPSIIDGTLDELVEARLIRKFSGTTSDADRLLIAQASLPQCWPQLARWIDELKDEWRRRMRLRSAAELWRSKRESPELLWGGSALDESERDPRLAQPEYTLERDFILASRKLATRKQFIGKARGAVAAVILLVIVLGIIGYRQAAKDARRRASDELQNALNEAEKSKTAAMEIQKDVANVQLSLASTLFGQNATGIGASENDPIRGLVWYGEAHELALNAPKGLDDDESEAVLQNLRSRLAVASRTAPRVLRFLQQGKLQYAAMSSDGRWAVTLGKINRVALLWNLDVASSAPIELSHDLPVSIARFSGDGRVLITGTTTTGTESQESSQNNNVPTLQLSRWNLAEFVGKDPDAHRNNWPIMGKSIDSVSINENGKRLIATVTSSAQVGSAQVGTGARGSSMVFVLDIDKLYAGRQESSLPNIAIANRAINSAEISRLGNFVLIATKPLVDKKGDGGVGKISIYRIGKTDAPLVESREQDFTEPINYANFVFDSGTTRGIQDNSGANTESLDDQYFVTCGGRVGGDSGQVNLWKIRQDKLIIESARKAWRHAGAVKHAVVSPDRRYIVSSGDDSRAIIVDMEGKTEIQLPHSAHVISAAFSPTSLVLATACRDRKVRLWDTKTGRPIYVLECGGTPANLRFGRDDRQLFAQGGIDQAIEWSLAEEPGVPVTLLESGRTRQAVLSQDLQNMLTLQQTGLPDDSCHLQVWNIETMSRGPKWSKDLDASLCAGSFVLGPQGNCVAAFRPTQIQLFWPSGGMLEISELHDMQVNHVCFSADGTKLLAVGHHLTTSRGKAKVWQIDKVSSQLVSHLPDDSTTKHLQEILYGSFHPSGKSILTCGGNSDASDGTPIEGQAFLWDISEGDVAKLSNNFKGHAERILFGTFSPDQDASYVITTSVDDSARVWPVSRAATTRFKADPRLAAKSISSASPSSRSLGPMLNSDSSADTSSKQFIDTNSYLLKMHTADVISAAFAPGDGQPEAFTLVVTVGKDGVAVLWDWLTGEQIALPHDGDQLKSVCFSSNGRYFLTLSEGSKARVWDRRIAAAGSKRKSSPLIAILPHAGPLVGAALHASEENKFLTVNYLGNPIASDQLDGLRLRPTPWIAPTGEHYTVQVRQWDITPLSERDAPSITAAACLLAQREVNRKTQALDALSDQTLAKLIEVSTASRQGLSAQEMNEWHRRQADQDEATQEWFAAAVHLSKLIDSSDDSRSLAIRRAKCYVRLLSPIAASDSLAGADQRKWSHAILDDLTGSGTMSVAQQTCAAGLALFIEALTAPDSAGKEWALQFAKKAIAYYEALENPNVDLLVGRARVKRALGRLDSALKDCDNAIANFEGSRAIIPLGEIQRMRARILADQGKDNEVDLAYQQAAESYTKLGSSASLNLALETYKEALKKCHDAQKPTLHLAKGRLELRHRDFQSENSYDHFKAAVEDLEAARVDFGHDWTFLRDLAMANGEAGDYEKSFEDFSQAIGLAVAQGASSDEIRAAHAGQQALFAREAEWKNLVRVISLQLAKLEDDAKLQQELLVRRASAYNRLKQWNLATEDLNSAIGLQVEGAADAELAKLRVRRAGLLANQENWDEAAADLQKAFDLTPQDDGDARVLALYRLAVVLLVGKKAEQYNACCQQMVSEYERTKVPGSKAISPATTNNVAWTLALAGNSGQPPALATQIAAKAIASLPKNLTFDNTLRLAYYREGKTQEVLDLWNESREQAMRAGTEPETITADHFVLAMTYHAMQDPRATDSLDRGNQAIDEFERNTPSLADPVDSLSIWSWLELKILRREAQLLIEGE